MGLVGCGNEPETALLPMDLDPAESQPVIFAAVAAQDAQPGGGITVADAMDIALAEFPGDVLTAERVVEGAEDVIEVVIRTADALVMVEVDGATGEIPEAEDVEIDSATGEVLDAEGEDADDEDAENLDADADDEHADEDEDQDEGADDEEDDA